MIQNVAQTNSAVITGKIEAYVDPNTPAGRRKAWLNRGKEYCPLHPNIHPDNEKDIRLVEGSTQKKVGDIVEERKFRYCPRCFAVSK